jgi:hypothetical protein
MISHNSPTVTKINQKASLSTAFAPTEFRIEYIQNKSPGHYGYNSLLGNNVANTEASFEVAFLCAAICVTWGRNLMRMARGIIAMEFNSRIPHKTVERCTLNSITIY